MQVADSAVHAAAVLLCAEKAGFVVQSELLASPASLHIAQNGHSNQIIIFHSSGSANETSSILEALKQNAGQVPCLVVADKIDQTAIDYMKAGARDCIARHDTTRLQAMVEKIGRLTTPPAAHDEMQQAIHESEEKFARVFHTSPDPIIITRLSDGVYIDVNEGFTRTLGYTRDEIVGTQSAAGTLGIWVNACDRDCLIETLKAKGETVGLEAAFRTKAESIVIALMSARVVKINGTDCILAFTRDITARKHAEMERDATIRLLHICNQAVELKELAQEITLFFKNLTNCEAVGLRLRDGPDYPYFETHGFSNEFVQAEKHLCAYQANGEPVCDDAGHPALACMCGNILQGRFDPAKPFFTQHGSFWTNSTTKLVASTTEADRQTKSRNRCTGEGYESIALIPLRSRQGTLGMLQLNDRQKDRFSLALIELLEALADYVTVALEKLQSEQALRSSEEHLRQVLNTAEAGYCFVDNDGIYRRVNDAFVRMHGYAHADELLGQHFSITQIETNKATANLHVQKLLAGDSIAGAEFSRRRKDGSTGYQTFSAHAVRQGNRILGLEAFLIDTSPLHSIHQQYRMLFEQMLDGFALHEMIFSPEGQPIDYRFIAMNPAFERITGFKASDCVGRTAREVLPGLENKWINAYSEVVKTGEPKRFEDFSRELSKHFEVMAFRPTEGRFACLIRDVSARKQLELQLLHAQKMDAVGQLAGGVAHDFNNFLAAIMMHLSLLQRTPDMGGEVKASLKELETEAKRAASLTRQLLMFSRRQVVQLSATDLNDLLTNLLKMLRRLIGEHIKLVFSSEATPLWIEADPGMIEQVVMNLCVNARDAMPHGGELKIEAAALHLASTEQLGDTKNRAGDFVCLTVNDNGSGMTQETLAHIFEPFFTTKDPDKGTGLGLATVYSIVKQHQGWIHVRSTPSHGSTFRIFLPTVSPPDSYNQSAKTDTIQGGSEGILVVEDDAGFRNLVGMTLKVLGYRVFEAINGREAHAIWEANQAEIGLLFADQVLPGGMTGLELGQLLRAEKPALRMIITTGYLGDSIKPEQLEAENIVFLPKPFATEALATAVRKCLDDTPAKNK